MEILPTERNSRRMDVRQKFRRSKDTNSRRAEKKEEVGGGDPRVSPHELPESLGGSSVVGRQGTINNPMETLRDQGEEEAMTMKFKSGAVRSSDTKDVRYDLVSPIGLEAVARACAEGAERYGDYNWEKGMPVHDLLNHVLRHINLFLSGDREEDHLGHAAWGCMAAVHSDKLWPELNSNLREQGCKPPQMKMDSRKTQTS